MLSQLQLAGNNCKQWDKLRVYHYITYELYNLYPTKLNVPKMIQVFSDMNSVVYVLTMKFSCHITTSTDLVARQMSQESWHPLYLLATIHVHVLKWVCLEWGSSMLGVIWNWRSTKWIWILIIIVNVSCPKMYSF